MFHKQLRKIAWLENFYTQIAGKSSNVIRQIGVGVEMYENCTKNERLE